MDRSLEFYEASTTELRERLIRVLGAPSTNRLVERAVVEISDTHPELRALKFDGDDITFGDLRASLADADDERVREAFTALTGVLLLLVARLLGREVADRLTEGVTIAEYLRKGGLRD